MNPNRALCLAHSKDSIQGRESENVEEDTSRRGRRSKNRSLAILPEKKEAFSASTRSLSVPLLINVLFSLDSDSRDSQP